jgi:hypothetical protein
MSITVQAMMLKLLQRIDPQGQNPSNSYIPESYSLSTVGVYDGERFLKQRQLDIYNEARLELMRALQFRMPKEKAAILGKGVVKEVSGSPSAGVYTLPADYFYISGLDAGTGKEIYLIPAHYAPAVKRGRNPYRTESASVFFVYPEGLTIKSPNGATYFANSVTVTVWYYGLSQYALSDVTGGSTVEAFDDIFIIPLLEIAEAISLEMGREELNKLIQVQIAGAE